MPPEDAQPLANCGYISADGINWEPVNAIDEFSLVVSQEFDEWAGRLFEEWHLLNIEPLPPITFKTLWWQDFKPLYRLIGFPRPYRSRYTVPMLRRNGKSHKKGDAWKTR